MRPPGATRRTSRLADGAAGPLRFEVAQLSVRFGPGPFERIEFDV